eukprot:CAMPEP_0202026432 /NCGR_PEP_ID=MMETSP0905-20130828/58895_1 /ASSEMBLY_ACC=CAM_ASM_000554 /TAXON_ID=420261 /ORGANISM="Thalassiosira antarctica, Strain CCMP982" /LENGTH=138 /DNA_ID=CAMNT_0048589651 /DNA_START=29 /DNA_END=442 /DNA_ORIENTATION=+
MSLENSLSNNASRKPCSISSPIGDARPMRKRALHSSVHSAGLITAAVAILSLSSGHATHQNYHQTPADATTRQQRRHLYKPLNTTKIESSHFLNNRYRWLRQSPALTRFLDETSNRHGKQRLLDGAVYYDDDAYQNDD